MGGYLAVEIRFGFLNEGTIDIPNLTYKPFEEANELPPMLDLPKEPDDAPADAPAEAPAEAPADAPADAPAEAPAEAPADAPTDKPTDKPKPKTGRRRYKPAPGLNLFTSGKGPRGVSSGSAFHGLDKVPSLLDFMRRL
jgi:hypothetical protein